MTNLSTIRRTARIVAILATTTAALVAPAGALASGNSTSITLSGGSLAFATTPSASNFSAATLNGSPQTVHTNFANWAVNDARGTGAGWHVTFQASQFTGTSSDTLPLNSLVLTEPAAMTPGTGNLATPPTVQCTSCTLDGASAVAVAHATAGAGQGTWTATQTNLSGGDLALTIPNNANADTYTSTLTFTLATGP